MKNISIIASILLLSSIAGKITASESAFCTTCPMTEQANKPMAPAASAPALVEDEEESELEEAATNAVNQFCGGCGGGDHSKVISC